MKSKKTLLITLLILILSGTGGAVLVLSGMYLYLTPQLPAVDSLRDFHLQVPLRVYSNDGKLLGEFGEKRRTPVKFDEIPTTYVNALLAAEDAEFFRHSGVSLKGLLRAVTELVLTGKKGSGGSTITMQVARNYYLSLRRIYSRKFKEILLALKIEKELTKEEIFELYVNVVFLGNRAYGISAASHVYYGKPLSELSLAQYAMIAGLAKGPSIMNPIINPPRAMERRNWILKRMRDLNMITPEEYESAVAESLTASYHSSEPEVNAPYVAEMARSAALEKLGTSAYTEGYKVYTSIDSRLQASANSALVAGVLEYDERHGYRGPEQQLPTADLPTRLQDEPAGENGIEVTEETSASDIPDFSPWIDALEAIPTYGGLVPAAVTAVQEQSIDVLLASGKTLHLDWNQGLSSAKPYISENVRGPAPQTAADIVAIGDVIRLRSSEEGWMFSQLPDVQAALVSLNPDNGAILSLVGGFDFQQSHFNRAIQAKRQPGSNFKPFVYTAALEHGMTPATLINDAPIVFDDAQLEDTWRPENDSGKFYGPTRLRTALYRSRNLVSIRVLREIGISNAIQRMGRFGFDEDKLPRDLSLALGSHALTPIEIATGYATFANGGYKIEPFLIKKIVDAQDRIVFEHFPVTVCRECDLTDEPDAESINDSSSDLASNEEFANEWAQPFYLDTDPFSFPLEVKSLLGLAQPEDYPHAKRVIDERTVFLIDSMLKDVVRRGTGTKALQLKRGDLGGKTGTTNGPNDAWFSGYNPDVVTTTWVGFDQFQPLGNNEFGGTAALPIWITYMREALKNKPERALAQPPGIVTVKIDPETGMRAQPGDPDAVFEYFRTEDAPGTGEDVQTPYDRISEEDRVTEELF